jgi:cephalosporin-C deacetylase
MTRMIPRLLLALLLLSTEFAAAQSAPIPQQLTFTPYHSTGIYKIGETVGWTVTPGPVTPTYAYKYTVRRNNNVVLKEGKLDLSSGKDTIELVGDEPEMIYVAIEPYTVLPSAAPAADAKAPPPMDAAAPHIDAAAPSVTAAAASVAPTRSSYTGGNTGRNNGLYAVGAAVAPLLIGLDTPRPADVDAFWKGKLAEQARIPINPVLTPVQSDVPGVELSIFTLDALGSKAHGYVAKPAKDGKFPALIQLQYAGVYVLNAHADAQRAASGWLVINIDSHDKQPNDSSGGIPLAYQAVGNTDREKSYFLDMYLRDSRVLDYLMTRPDWDGKTIVPAGADTNGDLHGRRAGYPNWPSDNPDIMKTALYFDPVNFASHIKAPVMAGMGFIDTTAPPAGIWTALNQIPGPKEPLPMIQSEHDNMTPQVSRVCPARVSEILDQIVRGIPFTPNSLPQEAK